MGKFNLKDVLNEINISAEYVNELAKEKGLIKRKRKITAFNLTQAACEVSIAGFQSFNKLAININEQEKSTVSKQAVAKKMTPEFHSFLISLTETVLKKL
jgi:3-methyladenine DNA glycosylase Tag